MLLSFCCDAEVIVRGRTTHYYECPKCGHACDVYEREKSIDEAPRDKMVRRGKRKGIDSGNGNKK